MNMYFKRAAALLLTVAIAASVSPAILAADDTIYTDGKSEGYGGSNISTTITPDPSTPNPPAAPETEQHVVYYHMRSRDKGTLEFQSARFQGRSTIGGENTPAVSLPTGWSLDGYYIGETRYTASGIAGYQMTTPTLEVEVRTYPDRSGSGNDDRDEYHRVYFSIRSGDYGELEFKRASVSRPRDTLSLSDIPVLTGSRYSITGYYVDGKKYSRSSLSRLTIDSDTDVEVRTSRKSSSDRYDDDDHDYKRPGTSGGYDWKYDLGYQAVAAATYPYGYTYLNGIPYSYAPAYGYGAYCGTVPFSAQFGVQFVPQNGQRWGTVIAWGGYLLDRPAKPVCNGYTFLGWSTSSSGSTGYWNFDRDVVTTNMTLYGIWARNKTSAVVPAVPMPGTTNVTSTTVTESCTVRFYPNNGKNYSPVKVPQGNRIQMDKNPTCAGYQFVGWATDKAGKNLWDFSRNTVKSDTSLYGVWQKVTTNPR